MAALWTCKPGVCSAHCTCNAFFTPDLLCINYCPLSTHDTSSVGVNQRPFRVFFLPEIHPNLETQASLRCAWYLYDAHPCMLSLWWSVPYIQHTQVNVSTCADMSCDKAMPCNVTVLAGPSSRMPWNAQSESAIILNLAQATEPVFGSKTAGIWRN